MVGYKELIIASLRGGGYNQIRRVDKESVKNFSNTISQTLYIIIYLCWKNVSKRNGKIKNTFLNPTTNKRSHTNKFNTNKRSHFVTVLCKNENTF